MNPDSMLLLEEIRKEFADQKKLIDKRFVDHNTKWESRFSEFSELEGKRDERVEALELAAQEFGSWKPTVESSLETVKTEVQKLAMHWERSVKNKSAADPGLFPLPGGAPPQPPLPQSVPLRPSAGGDADGPAGHCNRQWNRDTGYGSVTYTQFPDKGMFPSSFSRAQSKLEYSGMGRGDLSATKLPKLNFPEFSGENPKLWLSRCEKYFDMYGVEEFRWIHIASMYLKDAAARWFQSIECRLRGASWKDFSILLLERFGREQKELLIRQLFHISQTSSIADYVERFAELVDQLTSYDHVTDPVYYAMRFMDGLRDDIRSAVSLHRPANFDTAASLALLQDDLGAPHRAVKKSEGVYGARGPPRGPLPLPPPPRIDKQPPLLLSEEKKLCEGKSPEEKMAT
jgi:hypothetical protein